MKRTGAKKPKKAEQPGPFVALVGVEHFLHWGKLVRRERDVWCPVCKKVAGKSKRAE